MNRRIPNTSIQPLPSTDWPAGAAVTEPAERGRYRPHVGALGTRPWFCIRRGLVQGVGSVVLGFLLMACGAEAQNSDSLAPASVQQIDSELGFPLGELRLPAGDPVVDPMDPFSAQRNLMVERQIAARGVDSPQILTAMRVVPRHHFVPDILSDEAYADHPLPIGLEQTISQPYIVALMTDLLELGPGAKVLEIGTGSGYHAAVLSRVAQDVFSIEIVESLAETAATKLEQLGYDNVHLRKGDGYRGWAEKAPFDGILLTAAPAQIPQPLIDQLRIGGKLVAPVGKGSLQELIVLTKTGKTAVEQEKVALVRFVPMTGEALDQE